MATVDLVFVHSCTVELWFDVQVIIIPQAVGFNLNDRQTVATMHQRERDMLVCIC